ncbi:MAG: L-seryl-tRNA(Sec) selenium transferase [Nitriliruptoraceae bacterium]
MADDPRAQLSRLPQVDQLLHRPDIEWLVDKHGRRAVVSALRDHLNAIREEWQASPSPDPMMLDPEHIVISVERALQRRSQQQLTRVINATGVVLHTNLGRAPLSADARQAVMEASGYATVEFDLVTGKRGSRTASLGALAAEVSGATAATVVNNGAAALVLVLAALATDRDTIVSRGELVEIGGSYRLPDIMDVSGSTMVEVGTTNRTRIADYEQALGASTGLLLKVHRSNFALVGFTADVELEELVDLGARHGVPVVHDLGSGLIRRPHDGPLAAEPSVEDSIAAGVDLVIYSGDKLLGGPQAGIIAGREDLIRQCTTHPLARALRVDKLQRAALEATFQAHLRSPTPVDIPVIAMLEIPPETLRERAEALASAIGDGTRAEAMVSVIGGGAMPGAELPSWGITVPTGDVDDLAERLRHGAVPVIGRIEDARLVLDVRTVAPSQDEELADLVRAARSPTEL